MKVTPKLPLEPLLQWIANRIVSSPQSRYLY